MAHLQLLYRGPGEEFPAAFATFAIKPTAEVAESVNPIDVSFINRVRI